MAVLLFSFLPHSHNYFPPSPLTPMAQAAVSEVQLLSEANRLMGRRVAELEGQMQGGRSEREVEMERELAQVGGPGVEG